MSDSNKPTKVQALQILRAAELELGREGEIRINRKLLMDIMGWEAGQRLPNIGFTNYINLDSKGEVSSSQEADVNKSSNVIHLQLIEEYAGMDFKQVKDMPDDNFAALVAGTQSSKPEDRIHRSISDKKTRRT